MLVEMIACEPPREVIVIEAPAQSTTEVVVDTLLTPLNSLREQITAITGLGLDADEDIAALGLRRLTVPVPNADLSVSYLASGRATGRRILFIHGSPGNAEEWTKLLSQSLSDQYRIAIDRPGFGQTTPHEPVPSLAEQAGALAPLIARGDGRKTILVGYSFGGPVALRAAVDMPEHVAGLVLIGSAADPALEQVHPLQALASLEPFAQMLPRELANANTELIALRPELEALAQGIEKLAVPVTIVHGLSDTLVPPENVVYLHQRLPRSAPVRVVLVEGGDHFLPWTHPDKIEEAIAGTLRDLESPPR